MQGATEQPLNANQCKSLHFRQAPGISLFLGTEINFVVLGVVCAEARSAANPIYYRLLPVIIITGDCVRSTTVVGSLTRCCLLFVQGQFWHSRRHRVTRQTTVRAASPGNRRGHLGFSKDEPLSWHRAGNTSRLHHQGGLASRIPLQQTEVGLRGSVALSVQPWSQLQEARTKTYSSNVGSS